MAGSIDSKQMDLWIWATMDLGQVAILERGFATWIVEVLGIGRTGLGLGLRVGVVIEKERNFVANTGVS